MSAANNVIDPNVIVNGNCDIPIDGVAMVENKSKHKRPKRRQSDVWKHYKILDIKEDGLEECQCLHCDALLSCGTSGGTSHLSRHINKVCVYSKSKIDGQRLLNFSSSENGSNVLGNWKFDQDKSREDLTRLFIQQELSFRLLEKESFQTFLTNLQPKFKVISRFTLKRDCMKLFEGERSKLKEALKKSSRRICITTDLWTSIQTMGYIAITGHYIDKQWNLQKKILNFCVLPSPHTGNNISDMIVNCLSDWDIDKLCTITVDNASANDVVVKNLVEHFSLKSGLLLAGKIFHVRCWAHILNLIVQDGLMEIKEIVTKVRNLVKFVKSSQRRMEEFKEVARQERVPIRKGLTLDVCTRWNSTFLMLKCALSYMKVFTRLKARDPHLFDTPNIVEWKKAENICRVLELFYNATTIFSGHCYSTSNLFFNHIFRILGELNVLISNEDISMRSMASKMYAKFQKYWNERSCNLPLTIAVVLDPRYKFEYIRFCLSKVYSDVEVDTFMEDIETSIYNLYDEYASSYQPISLHESIQPPVIADRSGQLIEMNDDFLSEFRKKKKELVGLEFGKSEIEMYLGDTSADYEDGKNDKFDILLWWKTNSSKYIILSRIARDILAIPISTVASESAFSTGGRVLDSYRSRLDPSTVEALICTQDWLHGTEDSTDQLDDVENSTFDYSDEDGQT